MLAAYPCYDLVVRSMRQKENLSILDSIILRYLDSGQIIDEQLSVVALKDHFTFSDQPHHYLKDLRDLLSLNILLSRAEKQTKYVFVLRELFERIDRSYQWESIQIFQALSAINAYYCYREVVEVLPCQLESGAVAFDSKGYWPWGNAPLQSFQLELGVLWSLLGVYQGNKKLLEAAEKIAYWMLMTLDSRCIPLEGLFARKKDRLSLPLLPLHYLLNLAVGIYCGAPKFLAVAKKQLKKMILSESIFFDSSYLFMLSFLLDKSPNQQREKALPLPRVSTDPLSGFAAFRQPETYVGMTVVGGGTGLGVLRFKNMELSSYAPQILPYSDSRNYGILSPLFLRGSQPHAFDVECFQDSITSRGLVKLTGVAARSSTSANYAMSEGSGVWVDLEQRFLERTLLISTSFLSAYSLNKIAFCFYVVADRCEMGGKVMDQDQADSYKATVNELWVHGKGGSLRLTSGREKMLVQLSCLPKDDSCWGANYLVACPLEANIVDYSWKWQLV